MTVLLKLRCVRAAFWGRKEAKERHFNNDIDGSAEKLQKTQFMFKLIDNYKDLCNRKEKRCFSVIRKFSKIEKQYIELYNEDNYYCREINALQEQKDNLEKEITTVKSGCNKYKNYWIEFQKTGIVRPEMDARNIGELKKLLEESENKLNLLMEKKERIISEIHLKNAEKENNLRDKNLRLERTVLSYKRSIEKFYVSIEQIGSDFDKVWQFYWQSYINKKKKLGDWSGENVQYSVSFNDICELYGFHKAAKEDIFKEKRAFINTQVKKLINLKIEI